MTERPLPPGMSSGPSGRPLPPGHQDSQPSEPVNPEKKELSFSEPQEVEDLAAIQKRYTSKKRGRAKVEEEKKRKAYRRHAQLQRLAGLQKAIHEIGRALIHRHAIKAYIILAIAVLIIAVGIPLIQSSSLFSKEELQKALPQIEARAIKTLDAPVKKPKISMEEKSFTISYQVRKGTPLHNGDKAQRNCSISFIVDRVKSTSNHLQIQQKDFRSCR